MKAALIVLALAAAPPCAPQARHAPQSTLDAARTAMRRGELGDALALVDRGLSKATPDSDEAWRLRLLRGEVLLLQSQPAEVVPLVKATIPQGERFDPLRVRQKYLEARLLVAQNQLADVPRTLDAARRLGPVDPELGLEMAELEGQIEMRLSKWADADAKLNAVVAQAAAAGNRFQQARAFNDLGMGRLVRSRWDEALQWFNRVLAFDDLQQYTVYAAALSNAGSCYARLGEFDRALEVQRRAVALHTNRGPRVDFAVALGELGNTFVQKGDPREALPFYQQALKAATDSNLRRYAAAWAGNLASANAALGDWDQAERFNDEAKRLKADGRSGSLIHNTLNAAQIAEGRGRLDEAARLFDDALSGEGSDASVRWSAHAGLAEVALARSQRDSASRHFEAALDIIEKTRSDLLKTDYKLSFLTRLIQFYQEYVDALVEEGRIERALEVSESSRGRVLAERNGLGPPPSASVAMFRRVAARSGAVLLSYWLAPARSYVWVVSGSGVQCVRLPPSAEIATLVKEYRATIGNALANPLAADTAGARLYRMLVEPIERSIPPGGHLVIVPDGALHELNFETLPAGGAKPHYWIEDVQIEIAPGLSLLSATAPAAPERSLLLIGDPRPHDPEFPALRYASAEIDNVSKHFAAGSVASYQGDRASPDAYRSARPERFGFIHFTAHAATNLESPLDSAVILAGPEQSYKLYARDVVSLPLHAQLVTVSACRSAGERAYSGEGLVGFAWAFLRAGASRVVAGLWDVDDRSTADLMDRLYSGIAAGDSAAQALRSAKLALLASGGNAGKPYYWGPFQLFTVAP
jgi:CHAT domain-containing protein/tetratricopeptide (TPR) repeat protein